MLVEVPIFSNSMILRILLLLLMIPSVVFAKPLELSWDRVTEYVDGSIIPTDGSTTLVYRIYKKPLNGDFSFVFETKNNIWTWLVPSLGRYKFYITAVIKETNIESEPSNIIAVVVERIGRQE